MTRECCTDTQLVNRRQMQCSWLNSQSILLPVVSPYGLPRFLLRMGVRVNYSNPAA